MQNPPRSEAEARALLGQYSPDVQAQLINALYLGRDHIHSAQMQEDADWSRNATDHISPKDYVRILYEKASADASTTYLDKLLFCAAASGYDLKQM